MVGQPSTSFSAPSAHSTPGTFKIKINSIPNSVLAELDRQKDRQDKAEEQERNI